MLKLQYVEHFNYDRDLVFKTLRDKLIEYTKYVPNLTYVKILEKKQLDKDITKIRAEWMGHGQIPFIVRSFLKPEMIKWRDESIWDAKKYTCTWEIIPLYFKTFVECKGIWYYQQEKKGTKMQLDGILKIQIHSFPGVPDKIAQIAGSIIEKFIMRYLEPNMKANMKAVRKFLEEKC